MNLPVKAKLVLIRMNWIFAEQVGLDPIKFLKFCIALPLYLLEYYRFQGLFKGRMKFTPCLHDKKAQGGNINNEYFWQDLWVAQRIFERAPTRHVDVGSRIDGFVAHVASFRELEVLDIRPVESKINNVVFRQVDLVNPDSIAQVFGQTGNCIPSVSCLHALEHFGLGRYGDALNPTGYQEGIANISKLLSPKGILYLSTPIGVERVEFNANWVFDPLMIINLAKKSELQLLRLVVITSEGIVAELTTEAEISQFANQHYHLGIFEFQKK